MKLLKDANIFNKNAYYILLDGLIMLKIGYLLETQNSFYEDQEKNFKFNFEILDIFFKIIEKDENFNFLKINYGRFEIIFYCFLMIYGWDWNRIHAPETKKRNYGDFILKI